MKAEKTIISAVIITLNEEANIPRCLDSLKGIADEILVYDSFSTDNTPAICRDMGVRFFQGPWLGYALTKNTANEMATGKYILSLDADEALSETLKAELLEEKGKLNGAYCMKRKNFFCGKWVRFCGWYPDAKARLFPKDSALWEGEQVHEKLKLKEGTSISMFRGEILHYTVSDLGQHREVLRRYARLRAEEKFRKGARPNALHALFRMTGKFVFLFIFRLGFLDGLTGLRVCSGLARAKWLEFKYLRGL